MTFFHFKATICSMATAGILAACGGTTIEEEMEKFPGAPTYRAAQDARFTIGERFTHPTDDDLIPISGRAEFSGGIALGISPDLPLAEGLATVEIIFDGAGQVTGQATNFINEDDVQLNGGLTFANGRVDRGITVRPLTQATGTLTTPGGASRDLDIALRGGFELEDGSGLSMSGRGTSTDTNGMNSTAAFATIFALRTQ